ncbi:MAG: GldG family protein [Verrucomicrobiota bacterium]|nr:GldG family protein [Verrucomicrobiota bacterium]
MGENDQPAIESPWSPRRWRMAAGLNVVAAVLLAVALLLMVNHLFYRLGPMRRNLGGDRSYALSEKTRSLLATLDREVRVVAFFDQNHEYFAYVRALLKEYEYECAALGQKNLKIQILDPNRDLARTRLLQQQYKVAEPNVLVFDSEGRCKYLGVKDIIDKQQSVDLQKLLSRKSGGLVSEISYLGEQAFSSAILSVTQTRRPTVYFLSGHGEREIDDFSKPMGFSSLARALQRDNMPVKKFRIADLGDIPEDCSLLVIAGPTRKMAQAETDRIASYLDKNGRLLLLLNAGAVTGLENLLASWGVKLDTDVVFDPAGTLTGQEIFVKRYGQHPITRRLRNLDLTLYLPRSVEAAPGHEDAGDAQADKSRVFTLAFSSDKGWAEKDLNQNPAKFDQEVDRPGPIGLAVAVEKGAFSGIEVEIKPTRLVVVGNADFVSNGALDGGGSGNTDFFLNAANWLVEREALMAIGPQSPDRLAPGMNRFQQKLAFLLIVAAGPLLAALAGVLVWWRRRN